MSASSVLVSVRVQCSMVWSVTACTMKLSPQDSNAALQFIATKPGHKASAYPIHRTKAMQHSTPQRRKKLLRNRHAAATDGLAGGSCKSSVGNSRSNVNRHQTFHGPYCGKTRVSLISHACCPSPECVSVLSTCGGKNDSIVGQLYLDVSVFLVEHTIHSEFRILQIWHPNVARAHE